jgi:IclR family pca regulon transcriptional regulator
VGADVPLHASAAGKLLLAELSPSELEAWIAEIRPKRLASRTLTGARELCSEVARVRRRGWAQIVDELEDGLVSLAAPVRDRAGTLVAMIGVSGPSTRLNPAHRRALPPVMLKAAAEVECSLNPRPIRPYPTHRHLGVRSGRLRDDHAHADEPSVEAGHGHAAGATTAPRDRGR